MLPKNTLTWRDPRELPKSAGERKMENESREKEDNNSQYKIIVLKRRMIN